MATYRYFVKIINVDNRLIITIGDGTSMNEIFNEYHDGDPIMTKEKEITYLLQPTIKNILRFQGYNGAFTIPGKQNDPNPFHFKYEVKRREYDAGGILIPGSEVDVIQPFDLRQMANPNTWVIDNSYPLVKQGLLFIYEA